MTYTNKELSNILKNMAIALGASYVGIATKETLKNGPPSTNLDSALNGAKSAIVFAVPFNEKLINPFLAKEDFSLNENKIHTTTFAGGISLEIAGFLDQIGYRASPVAPNFVYRKDTPNGIRDRKPIISHKYLAAVSGIGFFGHSGHILTKNHGAAVALSSVVTDGELIATSPIEESEKYCDECKLCKAGCIPDYISDEKMKVNIGEEEFEYHLPKSHWRCILVCGGATGLDPSEKYSTWSPGRFKLPKEDEDFEKLREKAMPAYVKRPKKDPAFYHPGVPEHKMQYTCSTCQFICHPDKKTRINRYQLFKKSGVIVEDEKGNRKVVSPEKGKEIVEKMSENRKNLYLD